MSTGPTITRLAIAALALLTAQSAAQDNDGESSSGTLAHVVPFMDWAAQPQGDDQPQDQDNARRAPGRPGPARAVGRNQLQKATPQPQNAQDELVSFGVFSAPIELTTLIEYVGSALNINIVVKGSPTGTINFNAPVEVPKSKLIELLDAMLEQHGYTIAQDGISGFWVVQPIADLRPTMGSERASTQIISTPNIKPSLIVPSLSAAIGGSGTASPTGASSPIQAIDELGVLIVNAPARDIDRIRALVDSLLEIDENQRYIRFDLEHIAAPVARDRAVALAGGASNQGLSAQGRVQTNQQGNQSGLGISGGSLSNLAERIAVDPQGNALIFKGTDAEIARVTKVLDVIDVPNSLTPKSYFAGASAAQIADIASRRGLGEVVQISDNNDNQFGNFGNFQNRANQQLQNQFGQDESTIGGPVMVVNTTLGSIIYYGTQTQQEQLAALLEELDTEDERVVIREIVLNHSDAETVAELMTSIITGEQQTGESEFLPGSSGPRQTNQPNTNPFLNAFRGEGGGSDVNAAFDPDLVSVIADADNNQVLVKAPLKQQEELARLVSRLDRRKPQVYIEALIVSVEDSENFRLAIESQLTAGDFQTQSNFGLSSAGATFTDQRSVASGLAGLTFGVIMSDQIPIILNATQTDTDVRILSTPQLLVNDNQESEIVSIREEPFTEISQADNAGNNLVGFGGFEEAGTTLRVTPSISDGGFLRLEYFVELSNFTSTSGVNGSPPPRNTNTLTGNATIPSDATIILGGITVNNARDTVIKIPLLGDIPLVGHLFRDTSKITTDSKIYVFLTPRIMTDPNFQDLRLLSDGPYAEMDLDPAVPDLEPARIRSSAAPRPVLPEFPGATPNAPSDDRPEQAPTLSPALIDPSETGP